jgi:hypothetical protein
MRTQATEGQAKIQRRAAYLTEVAGRQIDALAKEDPIREMARIQIDELGRRVVAAGAESAQRRRVGLAADDIHQRLSRMLKAIGASSPAALLPYAANEHAVDTICHWLETMSEELDAREHKRISSQDVLEQLGKVSRGINEIATSNTHIVMVLGQCVENVVHFAQGHLMQMGMDPRSPLAPVNHQECAAIGLAARTVGAAPVALHLFAELYPEHAARLDRESLNRIASAALVERNKAQWEEAASVAKVRLRIHVTADSLYSEFKRTRRRWLGPQQPPESH